MTVQQLDDRGGCLCLAPYGSEVLAAWKGERSIFYVPLIHQRHMSWEAQLGRVFRFQQPPLTGQQIPAAGEGTELVALACMSD